MADHGDPGGIFEKPDYFLIIGIALTSYEFKDFELTRIGLELDHSILIVSLRVP